MTFYNQLSQALGYSGTLFNRPPGGTLLLRRLHKKPVEPKCDAKTVPCNIEQRFFREARITGYRLTKAA